MGIFDIAKGEDLAIDIGNNNTKIHSKTRIPSLNPSYIVLNQINNTVKAIGSEAYSMLGKTKNPLKVIKPLKGGAIEDFDSAGKMLEAFIKLISPRKSFFGKFNHIIAGVPFSISEIEKRVLIDLVNQIGSSKASLLVEPIAAAIGMGINIQEPEGKLVVDIGGGITEVVVISLSGIVNSNYERIGGDTLDSDIKEYFRINYQMEISLSMAEWIKINIGAAQEKLKVNPDTNFVTGKDVISGIPKEVCIDHIEVGKILDKTLKRIEQLILHTLEECPPELSGDIYQSGIHLTGGGSLLPGLKERLESKIRIPVKKDFAPFFSVAKGIFATINNPGKYESVILR